METTIKGEITEICDTKEITDKFKKRDFSVKTDAQYPDEIMLQMINGGCDTLDLYKVGDKVVANFKVQGRRKGDKVFNSLTVTKIDFNI